MILIAFWRWWNCSSISAQKTTKQIFVKICWQLKPPTRTSKCTAALCKWAKKIKIENKIVLNWHSPLGLLRTNVNRQWQINIQINITRLRIPTGGRQTSWLFTGVVEKLNPGLPRTTSGSGHNGIWTRSSHSATLPPSRHARTNARYSYATDLPFNYLHFQRWISIIIKFSTSDNAILAFWLVHCISVTSHYTCVWPSMEINAANVKLFVGSQVSSTKN